MGKTKIKKIEETDQLSVLSGQSSDNGQPVISSSETEKQKTDKRKAENRKQKTDNRIKKRSKKYREVLEKMDKNKKLASIEAVKQAQANSITKFEGTIEAHINTNVKNLRGLVNMPFISGKKLRILAFPSPPAGGSGQVAANLGDGVTIGNDETIAEIDKQSLKSSQKSSDYKGKIDFDVVVTTPEWMPKLAKIARILGPKSLMPNPKNGTISENLEKTITELQAGKTEYKTEINGQVIHLAVGKTSQNPEEIVANLKVIYNTVGRSKIKKIFLAPTMGPSVKVDLLTLS